MADPVVLCCPGFRTEGALICFGGSQASGLQARRVVAFCVHDTLYGLLSLGCHAAVSPSPGICEPVVDLSMTQPCFCLQAGFVTVGGIWMSLVGFDPCRQGIRSHPREPNVVLAAVAGVTIGIHSFCTLRFQ